MVLRCSFTSSTVGTPSNAERLGFLRFEDIFEIVIHEGKRGKIVVRMGGTSVIKTTAKLPQILQAKLLFGAYMA